MEYLPNGYTLDIPAGCFPLSTDSMALAHFVRLSKNARVLDLGSGCGTLGLLLCAADPGCHVTGVELEETAHLAAMENIRRNALEDRIESICLDLRQFSAENAGGQFSCCVSNPPYFSGGATSATLPAARQELECSLEELIRAASRQIKYGGDFFIVHRSQRLAEIIALGAKYQLEAKRLCLLHHSRRSPVRLVLLQLRKGGKPGLELEETVLYDETGAPTENYQQIYHIQEVSHGRNAVSGPHSHR